MNLIQRTVIIRASNLSAAVFCFGMMMITPNHMNKLVALILASVNMFFYILLDMEE